MAAPKPKLVEVEPESGEDDQPGLYGDKPIFTYQPKDGGDPIVFPAHATIRGEVKGVKYLEFLWEMDEDELGPADQIFAYLRRSGATREMKRRVVRLEDDERSAFFRAWVNHDDQPQEASIPPES